MEIKGIDFKVNAAAGARGYFGEGYWYHEIYNFLIPGFKDIMEKLSFVSKTATLNYYRGNLLFRSDDFTPQKFFSKCIKVYPLLGLMLNHVRLSNPGFWPLLETGQWQKIHYPFGISFMPVGESLTNMLRETYGFVEMLQPLIENKRFQAPIWVQFNLSCSNTDHQIEELAERAERLLGVFRDMKERHNIVIDLKVNIFMPNNIVKRIWEKKLCDIITISNTIKWGSPGINWKKVFWWRFWCGWRSPLAEFGGGALSGKLLFPLVIRKVSSIKEEGINIPLKVSGGIMSKKDVQKVKAIGGDGIEFATVISLRPWRVKGIVEEAERIF